MGRRSGILLPISSLSSRYGIGAFSEEAYRFVDFLERAGQQIWQILPLGPTGYGDSPYQSYSTFAGNPYFIDLEELIREGLLSREECDGTDFVSNPCYVEYEKIYHGRYRLLRQAYERANPTSDPDFLRFVEENNWWLEDYCLYMAIKNSLGGLCWTEWEEELRLRKPEKMKELTEQLRDEIGCYQFHQYLFWKQWSRLKKYANDKGIEILGDLPIYVSLDGSDAWAHPQMFQLDEKAVPKAVAGCPPDAFSATGQLWGNPLYDWDNHKKTGYDWWLKRIRHAFRLYDIVRIDHFRGFDEYYSIPYGDETALNGHWEKGPGMDLFRAIEERLGRKQIIAEDLGFLTDTVRELLKKSGYPGMKVLQFAFDPSEDSTYLPHKYDRNCVVYTGTHDNDTTKHWAEVLSWQDRDFVKRYLGITDDWMIRQSLIRLAHSSVADTCIIPIQDYLGLGEEARINLPSSLGNNWKWRLWEGALNDGLADEIRRLTRLYGRCR